MALKALIFCLVVGAAWAAQCGKPAVRSKLSGFDHLMAFQKAAGSSGRIVGGVEATPHSLPWQVALLSSATSTGAFCGGSLISEQWVVSAAHCCTDMFGDTEPPSAIKVRVGAHDLSSKSEANAKTLNVARVVRHPKYNDNTLENDFCLLKLSQPLAFNSDVSPICLPDETDDSNAHKCILSGWGRTDQYDWGPRPPPAKTTKVLKQADVTVLDQGRCQKIYPDQPVTDDMICGLQSGYAFCNGDSGGPLACQTAPGEPFKLVGVVSWSYGCLDKRYPADVYARTSSALDWISATISA